MVKLKDILNEDTGLNRVWNQGNARTGPETVGEFLSRHTEIKRVGSRYLFFHARPKNSQYTELKIGSYLESDPDSARHFAARDRGLNPKKDVEVIRLELTPDQIEPGVFCTLRKPIKIQPTMILK